MVKWRTKLFNSAIIAISVIAIFDGLLGQVSLDNLFSSLSIALYCFIGSLILSTVVLLMEYFLDSSPAIDKDLFDGPGNFNIARYSTMTSSVLFGLALGLVFAFISYLAVGIYILFLTVGAILLRRFSRISRAFVEQNESEEDDD